MPQRQEWIRLIGAAVMILFGTSLTALLKPQKSVITSIKNWVAGLAAGGLVLTFCLMNDIRSIWADVVMIAVSTFTTTIYPYAEQYIKKYSEKKIENDTAIK